MKIFLMLILFSLNTFAKDFFNFGYTTSSVLFEYTPPEKYDNFFRYDKSLGYNRYEISYEHCLDFCYSYGLGIANENFTIAKYSESSPSYISYKLASNYIYGSFKLSKEIPNNLEVLGYGNLGSESFSIEKHSGAPNGNTTESYVRIEAGCAARYHFVKLPSIKIERIYLEGGLSIYMKNMSDINFDSQYFSKGSLRSGQLLINLGLGISF